jgi:hypothetical protein
MCSGQQSRATPFTGKTFGCSGWKPLPPFASLCKSILIVADFLHANQLDPSVHVSNLLTCIPDLLSSIHQLDPCIAVIHCNLASKC